MDVDTRLADIAAWQAENPLRKWRERRGLSLRKAAPLIGVSFNSLENWEQGQYYPSAESMQRIAFACALPDIMVDWQTWHERHPSKLLDMTHDLM